MDVFRLSELYTYIIFYSFWNLSNYAETQSIPHRYPFDNRRRKIYIIECIKSSLLYLELFGTTWDRPEMSILMTKLLSMCRWWHALAKIFHACRFWIFKLSHFKSQNFSCNLSLKSFSFFVFVVVFVVKHSFELGNKYVVCPCISIFHIY